MKRIRFLFIFAMLHYIELKRGTSVMKNRVFSFVLMRLAGFSPMLLLGAFLTYGIWSTNLPPNWGKPFPEGTQIIQQTDTHQGFFAGKVSL